MKLRMHWKLIAIFTLLILFAMQFIGAYFLSNLKEYYLNNFSASLNAHAQFLSFYLQPYLKNYGNEREDLFLQNLENVLQNLSTMQRVEIQIIGPDGVVLETSQKDKWIVGQKTNQPEVYRALNGIKEESIRISSSTGERVKILAVPIKDGVHVLGAVLLLASMEEVYGTIQQITNIFFTGTILALLLTALIGAVIARTITTPIQEVTRQAAALAEGDYSRKVSIKSEDEIGQLGHAFNHLASRLQEAITTSLEERKKLSSVLTHMSDGVVVFSGKEGRIVLMNPRAQEMLLPKEDWHGKTIYECLKIPEDTEFSTFFEEPGSFQMDVPGKEGENLTLRVTMSPIRLGRDGQKGAVAVITDVTEQEKMNRERKEFVANVSHELRTPLTTIKSYLEALLEGGALNEPQYAQSFLQVVQNETERMIRLVSDLLLLSRIDSKQFPLNLTQTNLKTFLADVLQRFEMQMKKTGIQYQFEHVGKELEIPLDRDKMMQVFDNLISNALKYSHPGGRIGIKVLTVDRDWVEVRVSDEGIGIPEKDLKRIFERFYRVDKGRSRAMGGTGLGLSIAKEIVTLHGGEIWIESKVNKGTTVTVRLPKRGKGAA